MCTLYHISSSENVYLAYLIHKSPCHRKFQNMKYKLDVNNLPLVQSCFGPNLKSRIMYSKDDYFWFRKESCHILNILSKKKTAEQS